MFSFFIRAKSIQRLKIRLQELKATSSLGAKISIQEPLIDQRAGEQKSSGTSYKSTRQRKFFLKPGRMEATT